MRRVSRLIIAICDVAAAFPAAAGPWGALPDAVARLQANPQDRSAWAVVEEAEASIVFSPDGSAQAVAVQIGDGKAHYTICISAATGRAKIHDGTLENAEIGTIDLDAEQ